MSERESLFDALRNLPAALDTWRKEQGICGRCNGMGGYTVSVGGTFGGRTFVRCAECKGSGKE